MDQKTLTLGEIAGLVQGELQGDSAIPIYGVGSLDDAGPGEISFLSNRRYLPQLKATRASAVLVDPETEAPPGLAVIRVKNPSLALVAVVGRLGPEPAQPPPGIDPTAVVAPGASLGERVAVGAHSVIEAGASLGRGTVVYPQVYVGPEAAVGDGCRLYPGVVIRERVRLGHRVIVHPGTVIGCDGYGYVFHEGRHLKVPQVGTVVVEDDVEIGANCAIDRARFGETVIGAGTKIDNLVQIGHNVKIGRHCLLVAMTGVSGSAQLGNYCVLGGQTGIDGHIKLGDGAKVVGTSGVTRNVPAGGAVAGWRAMPLREYLQQEAGLRKLPELARRVALLEQRIAELEAQAKDHQEGR